MPYGGLLFRNFIICYSGPTYFATFRKAFLAKEDDGPISQEVQEELINKLSVRFYGYCLNALNNISKKTSLESFYIALVGHYHGMSREGLNFYGRLGFHGGLRTFDSLKKISLQNCINEYRYVSHMFMLHPFIADIVELSYQAKEKNVSAQSTFFEG